MVHFPLVRGLGWPEPSTSGSYDAESLGRSGGRLVRASGGPSPSMSGHTLGAGFPSDHPSRTGTAFLTRGCRESTKWNARQASECVGPRKQTRRFFVWVGCRVSKRRSSDRTRTRTTQQSRPGDKKDKKGQKKGDKNKGDNKAGKGPGNANKTGKKDQVQQTDWSKKKCFGCGELGHPRAECPNPKKKPGKGGRQQLALTDGKQDGQQAALVRDQDNICWA